MLGFQTGIFTVTGQRVELLLLLINYLKGFPVVLLKDKEIFLGFIQCHKLLGYLIINSIE